MAPRPARTEQTLAELEWAARRAAMAGAVDQALPLYTQAISRGSMSPDLFNDLGVLLAGRQQLPAAVVQFEMALSLAHGHPDASANLVVALEQVAVTAYQTRRWPDAVAGFTRLTQLAPDCAHFHRNAGAALRELGLHEQALGPLLRARALAPDDAQTCFCLGSTMFELADPRCASELERAIALEPGYADAHVNLAIVYHRLGQLDRAAATARRALELAPAGVEGHATLASILREQGETEAALEHYRRALELRPDSPSIFSSFLLAQQALVAVQPEQRLADHQTWGARFAAPLDPGAAGAYPGLVRDPERRLRVGYVSADLRSHSVASFMEPVLAAHHPAAVDIFCYSDARPDAVTARLRGRQPPERWRDTRRLRDDELARQIAADQIDVLVDLAGHTGENRLLCFARRPAPVQVTYCGYPGTTGMTAMGWRLTDAVADPAPWADGHHTERLWRLPHGFLCFQPDAAAAAPGPLPAAAAGGAVTFGSFNNLSKLNQQTVALWADILAAVPAARLLLKARALTDAGPRERLRASFAARGIAPERLQFVAYCATPSEHIALYDRVDIALDPFPYNGTTTTCEALWMGVPVVTLRGQSHAGRVGASLLHQLDCPELIAADPDAYRDCAVALAGDLDRLVALRAGLRARMAASPLTNATLLAADLEDAYRAMWRRWCAETS